MAGGRRSLCGPSGSLGDGHFSAVDGDVEPREERRFDVPDCQLGRNVDRREQVDFVDTPTGSTHYARRNDTLERRQ